MFRTTAIVSGLMAAVLLMSGRGKIVRDPAQMKTLAKVGFPEHRVGLLAAAEIAGALGLIVGLFWWPVGVAAATGIIAYFLGATGSHLRVRDWQVGAPAMLLLAGMAALVLRIASR
jgi:hypothetical protein